MRKIKCLILIAIVTCLDFSCVRAQCSDEEIETLKKEASKIKITYEHLGVIKENNVEVHNKFLVVTSNIYDDFYIHLSPFATEDFIEEDDSLKINLTTGTWHYQVFSSKCGIKISDIEVNLPRSNIYSLDPLCEGIDDEEFPLCGKYYKYDVDYETFEKKVTSYRLQNNLDNQEKKQEDESILNKVLSFISEYKIFLLITLGVILLIISIILITSKDKKRKILK